tara:strand:- start:2610 stop:3707 length:1098 start_codon:yes stop_codon:yes gene_type:complete
MALNFPSSPTVGQTHDATNGLSYYYDGVKWTVQGTYASSAGALEKIDDISSGFNGNTKTFNLRHNTDNISVSSALDVLISVGGVIQEPVIAYDVNPAASTITFTGAPPSGVTFFGILKSKFADQNVTPSDDTVDTSALKTGAVTTVKIADDSVDSNKLAHNIDIVGTFDVTGATTLDSTLGVASDFSINTNKFTVAGSDGDTAIAGTLGVTGATTLNSTLGVVGDVSVNTNKFTVAGSDGDTAIAGTLAVTGKSTFTGGTVLPKASTTLSDTALTVTKGWHEISGAGNNLTTIVGGTEGQILVISAVTTDLTIVDGAQNAGANTIVTGGVTSLKKVNHSGTDDGADTLVLMFNGTQWIKIAHGDN